MVSDRKKNPLNQTIKLVKDETNKAIPGEKERKQLVAVPRLPRIYGVPKKYKNGKPLRPIVSAINSPTYNLEGHLAKILKAYTGKTMPYAKNLTDFVEKLRQSNWEDGDILVSFDVVLLFTMVPVRDTLKIIKEDKWLDEKLHSLLEMCTETTVFTYQGNIYEQTDGMAMGSRLALVFANIFMEWFEAEARMRKNQKCCYAM